MNKEDSQTFAYTHLVAVLNIPSGFELAWGTEDRPGIPQLWFT